MLNTGAGHARWVALAAFLFAGAAPAAAGPFSAFPGTWNGDGTIAYSDGTKERIRCKTVYSVTTPDATDLNVAFSCNSDNYRFELNGKMTADSSGALSGLWSETTRSVNGKVTGQVREQRIMIRIDAAGFGATLNLVTKDDRQQMKMDSAGGGSTATANINLRLAK
jgi:hypothetical protein